MNGLSEYRPTAAQLTHSRNGGSTIPSTGHNRARYSTRQPVEVTIIERDRPMPPRYDDHTWATADAAPDEKDWAYLRSYVGAFALIYAAIGVGTLCLLYAVSLLIRVIAAIGS